VECEDAIQAAGRLYGHGRSADIRDVRGWRVGGNGGACGLDPRVGDAPYALKIVYYDIRNCHNYTVKRKLVLDGTTDEPCLTIHPGQTVSRRRIIAGWAAVRGMKPCD
jgi:hypothetical protein